MLLLLALALRLIVTSHVPSAYFVSFAFRSCRDTLWTAPAIRWISIESGSFTAHNHTPLNDCFCSALRTGDCFCYFYSSQWLTTHAQVRPTPLLLLYFCYIVRIRSQGLYIWGQLKCLVLTNKGIWSQSGKWNEASEMYHIESYERKNHEAGCATESSNILHLRKKITISVSW